MADLEKKLKHLDHIQGVIARMSDHSFLFKGWSISIAGALFGFAVVESRDALVAIALGTTMLFWGLDGYYLWIERGFVKLHNEVAAKDEADVDFSMAIDKDKAARTWLRTCLRPHLVSFYGIIVAVETIGIFVVRSK